MAAISEGLTVGQASDLLFELLEDGTFTPEWQVGQQCRVPGADGYMHQATITALGNDMASVTMDSFESPHVQNASVPGEVPLTYLAPTRSEDITEWSVFNVCEWLQLEGQPLSFCSNYFKAERVDGMRLLSLDRLGVNRFIPDHLSAEVWNAIETLKASFESTESHSHVAPHAAGAMPPAYVPPPQDDFEEPVSTQHKQLAAATPLSQRPLPAYPSNPVSPTDVEMFDMASPVAYSRPSMDGTWSRKRRELLAHGQSTYDDGWQRKSRRPSRRDGVFESELDRRKREYRRDTGWFERIVDVHPVNNPDAYEALQDVRQHMFMMSKVRRQKNRLGDKLEEYKEEKKIVEEQRRHLSYFEQMKFAMALWWSRGWQAIKTAINSYRLWAKPLKRIEGTFGSTTVSYFELVRWLVIINFCVAILWICFVVVPQALEASVYDDVQYNITYTGAGSNLGGKIIGATDSWENSLLFQGFYSPTLPNYDLRAAYFLVHAITLLLTLGMIVQAIGSALTRNVSFTSELDIYPVFAVRALACWQHGLTKWASVEAQQIGNTVDLRELLTEHIPVLKKHAHHHGKRFWLRSDEHKTLLLLLRLAIWIVWLSLTAVMAYFIGHKLTDRYFEPLSPPASLDTTDFFNLLLTPFVLSVANVVVPLFINALSIFEFYTPQASLLIDLARQFLFRTALFGTLLVTFMLEYTKDTTQCWETTLGQLIYRLLMMDFFVELVATTAGGGIWASCYSLGLVSEPMRLRVSASLMDMIYRQVLVWFGSLFSPMLPAIGVFFQVILFFANYLMLIGVGAPPRHSFVVGSGPLFYKQLIFVGFLMALVPTAWSLVERSTSTACGPFAGLDTMYSAVPVMVDSAPESLEELLSFLGTAAFVLPALFILASAAFVGRYHVKTKRSVAMELRHWLALERADTRELLRRRKIVT
eukprot:m.70411 g.70411  ORF g.70411 m.70411 type:complete len:927 (+) comp14065_c0_seq1:114-2894(+)